MKLIDSNILLYLVNRDAPEHAAIRNWWQEALAEEVSIGLSWLGVLSFLRIATHPRVFDHPLSVNDALQQMDEWLSLPNVRIVKEDVQHSAIMSELLAAVGVGGNLVSDAHLAALAISRSAVLYSCDNDFARFPKLHWINPLLPQ
ncbi:MAG: TA system VapC family ribonuclease toxin [Planctomycetia bacterium]|nr:TA system VapC family ribonuclease toxin [Planctomycetia bacterium]